MPFSSFAKSYTHNLSSGGMVVLKPLVLHLQVIIKKVPLAIAQQWIKKQINRMFTMINEAACKFQIIFSFECKSLYIDMYRVYRKIG